MGLEHREAALAVAHLDAVAADHLAAGARAGALSARDVCIVAKSYELYEGGMRVQAIPDEVCR